MQISSIIAGYVDTLYSWSALNTEEIGKVISDSLALLIKTYPIEKIHLVGKFVICVCTKENMKRCMRFTSDITLITLIE